MLDINEPIKVIVTVDETEWSDTKSEIYCIGRVSRDEVFEIYKSVDALLFLSSNESLGMPILEAVKCNIPIICPYAEYTHHLGSSNCFFFHIDDPSSLERAIQLASSKLLEGWWPDWHFEVVATNINSVGLEEVILNDGRFLNGGI